MKCLKCSGPPKFAPSCRFVNEGFGEFRFVSEYDFASSAELSKVALNPQLYSDRPPPRALPIAADCAYCEVAELFTLPLIRNPSFACCAAASCGGGGGAPGPAALAC